MTQHDLDECDVFNPAPLLFKTAAAFCCEYVPLAYVLEPIVRTSALYTLTARTGAGKTALAIVAALAVATGREDIVGMPVETGRVAYLSFENPEDFRMRLAVATHRLGIDLDGLADRFVILDKWKKPEEIFVQLQVLAAGGGPFVLIVVDTLAAAFDGRNINDNVESGNFIRRMRPLTTLPGLPAVVVAAHPTKNAADDNLVPYGGGAILNEVDGNLTLSKRADTGNTVLHWQGKFRGLEFQPRVFRFEEVSSPRIVDRHGRSVPLPMLWPTSVDDGQAAEEDTADLDVAILRILSQEPVPPLRALAGSIGRSKTGVEKRLRRMRTEQLVEQLAGGRWILTAQGKAEVA